MSAPTLIPEAGDTRGLVGELNRMKVLFQLRAVTAAMGLPQPDNLPTTPTKEP